MGVSPDNRTAKQAEIAIRRTEAMRLAVAGLTYQEIADRLGYSSRQVAQKDVKRALDQYRAEQRAMAEHMVTMTEARLDDALRVASEVMHSQHFAHSGGTIVQAPDASGELRPLYDDGPRLAAVDRVRAIEESRRKLLGLDAPTKAAIDLTVGAAAELAGQVGTIAADVIEHVLSALGLSAEQRAEGARLAGERLAELAEQLKGQQDQQQRGEAQ